MAVLVEAISVIIRADRLEPFGTWDAFKSIVTNQTLCADNELVRVGFMSPSEVSDFVNILRSHGLTFLDAGSAKDIVVADQQSGFTSLCDWAEFGHVNWQNDPNKPIAAARLKGSIVKQVLTPDGWTYEQSLSREFGFVSINTESDTSTFIAT